MKHFNEGLETIDDDDEPKKNNLGLTHDGHVAT